MKLIILFSVVAWSSCAKLDRTYLPPSHAQSSAGSNFLQAPNSDLARGSSNDFRQVNDFSGSSNNGNGFNNNNNGFQGNALNGNGFPGTNFNQNANGNGDFSGNFNTFNRPERPQAAYERNAAILRQDSQNDGETYSYAYETENGIYAEENGVATNGVEAQGSYSYTGDDGQVYTVRYTADQNGFVPVGDHLPTPPPIPEEILKALDQNARDEAAGIFDDGSYNEGKYGDDNQYNGNFNNGNNYDNTNYNGNNNNYNNNNANDNNNYNNNNGNNFRDYDGNDEDSIVTNSAVFRTSQRPSEGSRGFNGATKAYLPPVQSQRSQFGARARSRPSFNARDGYNY